MIANLEAPAEKLGALLQKLSEFNEVLAGKGLVPLCFVGSIIVLTIVGSGAFSASIAESRLRSRNFHFLLGLLMPVMYPAAAMVLMTRRKFKSDDEEEEKEFKSSIDSGSNSDGSGSVDEPKGLFSYDYFKEMMYDANGSSRGPFFMRVDDVELRVERISDVLPELVIIETINADGNQQTMRLPFSRITGCREI